MKLLKRFVKADTSRGVLCWLIAQYIRFVYATSRKKITIHAAAQSYMRGEQPILLSFWHGRLLMMPIMRPLGRRMHVLISTHRDGELIARTMHHLGFGAIRGSSRRGGIGAAVNVVKTLKKGDNVSITPDGPRGPAMQVQPGILTLAALAKVPIVPMTCAATRCKRMPSWDRFMVALPFGTLHYIVGAPMWNPTREALEQVMVQITEEADAAAS